MRQHALQQERGRGNNERRDKPPPDGDRELLRDSDHDDEQAAQAGRGTPEEDHSKDRAALP